LFNHQGGSVKALLISIIDISSRTSPYHQKAKRYTFNIHQNKKKTVFLLTLQADTEWKCRAGVHCSRSGLRFYSCPKKRKKRNLPAHRASVDCRLYDYRPVTIFFNSQ